MNRHAAPGSLPEVIERLSAENLLYVCDDAVDPLADVGAVTRAEQAKGARARAVLFTRIAGYPGWRLLTNGCATTRHVAAALGLPAAATRSELRAHLAAAAADPVAPEETDAGGAAADVIDPPDLTALPVPRWHPLDGGRFVGTWHLNITRHPENGSVNAGVYRMQIIDAARATVSVMSPHSHLRRHLELARSRGTALPMAVAIGVPECMVIAGAAGLPYGTSEFGFAGALLRAPVRLERCRTVDCVSPAAAQIVIEGTIVPGREASDGPFFDFGGLPSVNPHACVFEVSCIRHAASPVFRGSSVGRPGAEDLEIFAHLAGCGLVDFHGPRLSRRWLQELFRRRAFRLLQWSGRVVRLFPGGVK